MTTVGYLGLDLGGAGAKAAVYDGDGRLLGSGRAGYTPVTDPNGHTEIPIGEIYEAARASVREAVAVSQAEVRAMAVSSQGETFVSLDADDKPLHDAIVWYDSRASDEAEELAAAVTVRGESAAMISSITSGPKVMWLRKRRPDVMARAARYLLLPDYLAYRLTGEAVSDPCTACSAGLCTDDESSYSPTALAASGIEAGSLARIQQTGTPIGKVLPHIAAEWGLSPDVTLVTGTNDQYAGALGAGNCRAGIVSETTGTCLALVTLSERLPDPMPQGMFGGQFPIPQYKFALAYAKTAGVTLDWFRRQFAPDKGYRELDEAAAAIPEGSRGLTFLPHFDGMFWPVPDPNARGFICGLTLSHTSADVYRSILESLSFSLRENVEFLQANGFKADVIRSIGGGAKSDLWLQIKADVLGVPVERPVETESATLGAAAIAAVGVGARPSLVDASDAFFRVERVFEPRPDAHAAYERSYSLYREYCVRLYGRTD